MSGRGGSLEGGGGTKGARDIGAEDTAGSPVVARRGEDGGVVVQAPGCTARWTTHGSACGYARSMSIVKMDEAYSLSTYNDFIVCQQSTLHDDALT